VTNCAMFYGTVTGGDGRRGHSICMDIFPDHCKIVTIRRTNLTVLDKGAEEPRLDPKRLAEMDAELLESANKRKSPETRSEEAFPQLDEDTLKAATVFECTYQDNTPPILCENLGQKRVH
jgi:hypothetical protein